MPSSAMTTTNKFGEIIADQQDLFDLIMKNVDIWNKSGLTVSHDVDIERMAAMVDDPSNLLTWTFEDDRDVAVPVFDQQRQAQWFMPDSYKNLDVAQYVLDSCVDDAELQRCGQELLMFQQRDLFDLLRYLIYLVDVLQENRLIWGVGRGSSVASFVLYKIGVHRINSLHYDLDPSEFLR